MDELDDLIEQEIYFEMQKIDDYGDDEFSALLFWIVGALQANKSLRAIKAYIHKVRLDIDLDKNLKLFLSQQSENITGKKKDFDLGRETFGGYTFDEAIKNKRESLRHRAIRFTATAKELIKDGQGVQSLIRDTRNKQIRDAENFWRTNAKAGRDYGYASAEVFLRLGHSGSNIKGWLSVAVLDSRTSAICIHYHNQFYPFGKYTDRGDIPNRPPRHPRCRSILFMVPGDADVKKFKSKSLKDFFRENPETGKDIMGKEKYRLWEGGKSKVESYIDIVGGRWYRNDEIVKRLGIRSKKRLQK